MSETTRILTADSMPKTYAPREVEDRLYQFWESSGYFTPQIVPNREPFTVIMPPPNVTGELHLGHALTATVEDILTRWHRMLGDPTLWLPGVDHAGIAGQNVVEQLLAREGQTRHDLGREAFVERVWEWMRTYRGVITGQHKRLGVSCDWTRERFTMDPGPSRAVRTTFKRLFDQGLIYRGERIINWCPRCATALSDLEVDHEEVDGHIWHIRYPLEGGDGAIEVATTRPETMLGDTGVAVHPDDDRYRHLIGRHVILPILGRRIPIVADEAVDPAFGTGAVKVTPAHDPTDFEIGQRHGLPILLVMNLDVTMNAEAGPYQGRDRLVARQAVVDQLEREGLLVWVEPHRHAVGHCQRCRTVVEPIVSKQWFVRIRPLADPARQAVVDGRITIVPDRFTKVYRNWMDTIRDWCISRQLWWGHRIPVWYCDARGEVTVAVEDPAACAHCGSGAIRQDPDVLDTWFSSGLWPHSTLGWPDPTEDLAYFYPTSVMETGYDILFFWVARMIMLGIANTGEIPFRWVYLHGLVRDERGEKMSKSKGNVVNPIEVMDEYGTDALRITLSTGGTPGNDLKLSPARLAAGRSFATKIWNATRFVLTATDPAHEPVAHERLEALRQDPSTSRHLTLADRWIVSRFFRVVEQVDRLLRSFQLGEAGRQINDFLWGEFCDWYIEIAKLEIRQAEQEGRRSLAPAVLRGVLEGSLRLLHPFMPFVTEELWQHLTGGRVPAGGEAVRTDGPVSLMVMAYPRPRPDLMDPEAERSLDLFTSLVREVRSLRAEYSVPAARWIEATVVAGQGGTRSALEAQSEALAGLARVRPLSIVEALPARPERALTVLVDGVEAYLPLAGLFDLAAEVARLDEELRAALADVDRLEAKLANAGFVGRAPAAVVEKEREKLRAAQDRVAKLASRRRELA